MSRQITCDICETVYKENRRDSIEVKINDITVKVYIDLNSDLELYDYNRVDACLACKKQVLQQVLVDWAD